MRLRRVLSGPRGALLGAVAVAALFLVAPIGHSGLWDPPELDRAELARRIAIQLFGAKELALDAGPNGMPTLSDLGGGELSSTSTALGFAALGLHDYAGRLPLAVWAVAGLLVLFFFISRLANARAALLAAIALATMPLYFMQARTMLGDVVMMAAFTAAFCGAVGAMLDRSAGATIGWSLTWLVGLAAGYLARGLLIGVALPALGVGLTWLVVIGGGAGRSVWLRTEVRAGERAVEVRSDASAVRAWWRASAIGLVNLLGGALAGGTGWWLLAHATAGEVSRALGLAVVAHLPLESTFDLVVRDLGHALFPWSAFLPFAFGRLWWPAAAARRPAGPASVLRAALLIGAAVAYGGYALVAPHASALPFAAPALLAAIAALVIDDYWRGAPPSPVVASGTLLLGVVLLTDFERQPEVALVAFGAPHGGPVGGTSDGSGGLLAAAAWVFLLVAVLGWAWRDPALRSASDAVAAVRGRLARGREVAGALAGVYRGNLVFGALVVEAALVGLGAMLLLGRVLAWRSVSTMPRTVATLGLNAWWAAPLAVLAVVLVLELARLTSAVLSSLLGQPAAALIPFGALLAGGLMCFGYYAVVAGQLSPKEAFESYARLHAGDEPLGAVGVRAGVARYYAAGGAPRTLANVRTAQRWLDRGRTLVPAQRRWLVFRRRDLAALNAAHRRAHRANLAVIDARSQQILLASNQLAGQPNHNPTSAIVLDRAPPSLQHPLDGRFGNQLAALGWELRTEHGELADYAVPSRPYHLRLFFRVLAPQRRSYKVFIHVDGYRRRHNGDHQVLGGDYPMRYWLVGDVIVDDYEMVLEPNFLPGRYTVYFGFFRGKQRLEVTRGRHHDNRMNGGVLVVR